MEIEKKFLAEILPFDLKLYPHTNISQAYICTNPTIRIRQSADEYFLTVKGPGALYREEFELSITKTQFTNLAKKVETSFVSKIRYFIPIADNLTAEVDIYENNLKGLVTIEVEFDTIKKAQDFSSPSWFGKDITDDNRYKNTNLSIYGIPK